MPLRATKRGAERTPLHGAYDVIVCGASFAGLAIARALSRSDARVLVVDRYAIGERQTSACAAPVAAIAAVGAEPSIRQRFRDLVIHTPHKDFRWSLPFEFATFDYARMCALLWAQSGSAEFETATVTASHDDGADVIIDTDRGAIRAPLVVDALGWRRVLDRGGGAPHPPVAQLSRGLEIHPAGAQHDLEVWLDPDCVRRGYGWNFPAGDELRVGVGSFDPRDHVRIPTARLSAKLGLAPAEFQGNWIPHQLNAATDGPIFFAGDSAGHCLPATAEGIRPALCFGTALGRELTLVIDGRQTSAQALSRYSEFHERHRPAWRRLLQLQHLLGALNPYPALTSGLELLDHQSRIDRGFRKYLRLCSPELLELPS